MVPPTLWRYRAFSVMNAATFVIYAAFAVSMVFLALFLQERSGWSALAAGASTVPVSLVMVFAASRAGRLAQRTGPRVLIAGGSVLVAVAFGLLALIPGDPSFLWHLLPLTLLQGAGMSLLVAPLTGTVLAAVPDDYAGTAAGINNAISRTGGLLAIAALPPLVGLRGADYNVPSQVEAAFRMGLWCCSGAMLVAAVIVWTLLPAHPRRDSASIRTR